MSVKLMHVILFISQYIIIDVSPINACDTVYFTIHFRFINNIYSV